MNINLTMFQVEFLSSGSIRYTMNSTERVKDDKYSTFYVISHNEIPLMLDCINGKSSFYPFFDDGLYHIKLHPYGITSLEKHGSTFKEYWFNYPLKDNLILLELIEKHYKQPFEYMYIDTELDIKKFQYRNRVKWIYHDRMYSRMELTPEGFNYIEYPLYRLNHNVIYNCKNNPELKDYLQRLNRIAQNHCINSPVTVELSFDSNPETLPTSYYFFIHDNGQKIMNGGIIAHKQNDNSYQYSMHT